MCQFISHSVSIRWVIWIFTLEKKKKKKNSKNLFGKGPGCETQPSVFQEVIINSCGHSWHDEITVSYFGHIKATDKLFDDLMGTQILPRKRFIQQHSAEATY